MKCKLHENPSQSKNIYYKKHFTIQIEPGLGESELIYTLLNSAVNLGAMIGGLSAGFLVRCVPYWYLWLLTLISHIFGNILYSTGNQAWIIMIARLLVGCFTGASLTLSVSYVSTSSDTYIKVKSGVNKINNKDVAQLRSVLLSILSFAFTAGSIIGPGKVIAIENGRSYRIYIMHNYTFSLYRNGCFICSI